MLAVDALYSSLLIEMSADICKLILKETNLWAYNNSSAIYRVPLSAPHQFTGHQRLTR